VIFDTNALASDEIKLSDRPDPPPVAAVTSRDAIRRADLASPLSVNKAVISDAWVDAEYRVAQLPKLAEADQKFRALRDAWIKNNPEKMRTNPELGNNMGAVVWWMIDNKHETLALIRAGKLMMPTILIWGWNDPFAPYTLGLDTMKTIAAANPRTEMHFLNHAGHFVFAEQPEPAARLIVSFVSANP
jgi:pimeloyl-ACP methyl ester carboxylesterase